MSKTVGRPKSDKSRRLQVNVRLRPEEVLMVEQLRGPDESVSEVIRRCLITVAKRHTFRVESA